MKKTYKEPSIQLCMTRNIILCVLIPLFFALAVLCGLLNYNLSAGTVEAYQMMFNQNIQAIDSAILQSKHRLTRAHREKQLKMSCQALHNAPPNRT